MLRHASELVQATFNKASERFDAVTMGRPLHKLVVAVEHPVVPVKAHIHQAIVAAPAIGVDLDGRVDFTLNEALQDLFRTVGYYFGVHLTATPEQAEDNRFAARYPTSVASHPRAELRFIQFERPPNLTGTGQS